MAEDDIESYWEGIRPREPAKQDVFQVGVSGRLFASADLSQESLSDLWERPPSFNTPNPPVVREARPQRTPEQIAAWLQASEDAQLILRNREESLQARTEMGRALAPIRQALITELGREPTRREVQDAYNRETIRTLQQYATVPETQEELEALVHRGDRSDTEGVHRIGWAEAQVNRLGEHLRNGPASTPFSASDLSTQNEVLGILREELIAASGGVSERDRRRAEYARLAFEEGLPENTTTGDLSDPNRMPQGLRSVNQRLREVLGREPNMREVLAGIQRERELDRPLTDIEINDLLRELSDLELGELEELANGLETVVASQRETLGVFTRPTEPAVPVTLPSSRTPMGGDPSSSEQMRRLENLQQSLVALGFSSDSISLGASGDQSIILAFHRSPSVELETTSRMDNVTITFTHRR